MSRYSFEAVIASVHSDDPPPHPPIWTGEGSLEAFERRLIRWVREMIEWARHHHHHRRRATGFRLVLSTQPGGDMGAVAITVDTTTETITAQFTDDHGDAVPAPTDSAGGAVTVVPTSSDPSVATADASGAVTPLAVGKVSFSGAAVDSVGNPYPDAATQWTGTSDELDVNPGAAAGFRLSLSTPAGP